jgi:hypothetical protein
VDDCLKKERELRISPLPEEEDGSDKEDVRDTVQEEYDDDDDDDDNDDNDAEDDDEDDSENDTSDDDTQSTILPRATLQIDASMANTHLSSHAIYTPSRDVVDNFVPGTLDEDQLEMFKSPRSLPSPHDIDPTYPSDDDDEGDQQSHSSNHVFISPVRFISRLKNISPQIPTKADFQRRSKSLSRTESLPWGRKSYALHLKPHVKHKAPDQPRCAAIAIVKAMEHKKHHRRDKKEDGVSCKDTKGVGVEAMAAMARGLTNKQNLGLLAVSV